MPAWCPNVEIEGSLTRGRRPCSRSSGSPSASAQTRTAGGSTSCRPRWMSLAGLHHRRRVGPVQKPRWVVSKLDEAAIAAERVIDVPVRKNEVPGAGVHQIHPHRADWVFARVDRPLLDHGSTACGGGCAACASRTADGSRSVTAAMPAAAIASPAAPMNAGPKLVGRPPRP